MALELEAERMNFIGLGNHYQWYNGSPSCATIRLAAASLDANVERTALRLLEKEEEVK